MYIREYPGVQFRWEYVTPEDLPSQRRTAEYALRAAFALMADWCEPLALDLTLAYIHPEYLFALDTPLPVPQDILLAAAHLPQGVERKIHLLGQVEVVLPALTEASLLAYLDTVLAHLQAQAPDQVPGWERMDFNVLAVRLPAGVVARDASTVEVTTSWPLDHPVIQRASGTWVAGPLQEPQILTAPVEFSIDKLCNLLTLDLVVHWSVWYEPAAAGYAELERVFATLAQLGWVLKYGNLPAR